MEAKNNNLNTYVKQEYRNNIIRWIPFQSNNTILLYGYDEEIVHYLTDIIKCNVVITKNEVLINSNQEKYYDYIIILNSYVINKNGSNLSRILKDAKKTLKYNGRIIAILDNILGAYNWDNPEYINTNGIFKMQIEKVLKTLGFYYKFYYPLPNSTSTNIIFTDDFLPTSTLLGKNIDIEKSSYQKLFGDNNHFQLFIKENIELFKHITNTYLVEISNIPFEYKHIFISYQNLRKEKYQLQTMINGKTVTKKAINEKAQNHILQLQNNISILHANRVRILDDIIDDGVESQYLGNVVTFDEYLLNLLKKGEIDNFIQKGTTFFEKAFKYFQIVDNPENTIFDTYNIIYDKDLFASLSYLKDGLYDMIFQNCFYHNEELIFFDQEWIEQNVPLEFIMFRSYLYINNLNDYYDFFKIMDTLGIAKYLDYFWQLEAALQENINDSERYGNHISNTKTIYLQLLKKKDIIENNKVVLQKQKKLIDEQQKVIQEQQKVIQNQQNSFNEATAYIDLLEQEKKKTIKYKITKAKQSLFHNKGEK